ncbi:mechanosensitive ion channel family protein [Tautonia plasticadhaerens]|uniref:Small-conductance mechanosensitive channel n=1 Tax=Tautonia plasticadhaerens TaxID=2527974 RepID=A0A518HDF0_9BACT|nr:mechanosensitive ion channel family protein [Tautonia plasticadhaerens]QDV38887.1 Small-conductance mechanosensitive channel [Tautonia plasticadhaerens]
MTILPRSPLGLSLGLALLLLGPGPAAPGQEEVALPPIGGDAADPPSERAEAATPAPTEDNPEATIAEAAGPIAVEQLVPDDQIERKLRRLLPRYPGVRRIGVEVEEGVVTLTGHVEDAEVRDRLRDFVRRVEGVTLVLNQTRTDAQVLSAGALLAKRLGAFWDLVSRTWLAALAALGVLIGSILLARAFSRYSEALLSPLFESVLLRSVAASVIGLAIVLVGVYAALEVMGVARAVLSVVGLAGAVALALSFAFRDFAENFIASLLLGVRRPFRVGDYVEVAGQSGVVRALTTRATVLVTLEGHQVRVPNAAVFKNVVINRTASDAVRSCFDVVIGYDASAVEAQRAIASALLGHDGILDSPAPRTLVESLEAGGVRLRTYFWTPSRGVDAFKLQSDARLKAKVALQEAGITPPPTTIVLSMADRVDVSLVGDDGEPAGARTPHRAPERARSNLRIDAEVASSSGAAGDAQPDAIDQAMTVARDVVGDEGDNLLQPDGR